MWNFYRPLQLTMFQSHIYKISCIRPIVRNKFPSSQFFRILFSTLYLPIYRTTDEFRIFIPNIRRTKLIRGHHHWKVVQEVCCDHTSFFQASRHSLAYQFIINAPLVCLPFSTWLMCRKILHFQPSKFQLSRWKFLWIFLYLDPSFFKENPLSLNPTFGNQRGTCPPNKS